MGKKTSTILADRARLCKQLETRCVPSVRGQLVAGVAGVERAPTGTMRSMVALFGEPPDMAAGGSLRLTTSHPSRYRVRRGAGTVARWGRAATTGCSACSVAGTGPTISASGTGIIVPGAISAPTAEGTACEKIEPSRKSGMHCWQPSAVKVGPQ